MSQFVFARETPRAHGVASEEQRQRWSAKLRTAFALHESGQREGVGRGRILRQELRGTPDRGKRILYFVRERSAELRDRLEPLGACVQSFYVGFAEAECGELRNQLFLSGIRPSQPGGDEPAAKRHRAENADLKKDR